MIIGITGVFGSGKTTIAEIFSKYGYKHINVDKIGHELLNKPKIKNKVIQEFGNLILTKNKIDRNKLKEIVFYDNKKLTRLNKIIHPPMIKEIKNMLSLYKKYNIIIDGALLIEAKALDLVDKLIVVKINKIEQLKRVLKKKKYTTAEIKNILKSQLSQKEKLKYADMIIDNSKTFNHSIKQVNSLLEKLK